MSNEYKKTLARFEAAVRAHEFSGGEPPEDRPGIEREYEAAKAALVRKLVYRSPKPEVTFAEIDRLLEFAIEIGRSYWDGYYGSGSEFHMSRVREGERYKALTSRLKP